MLTIAIPTFNRNHLLQACVDRLLPQMDGRQRLLIVDNQSDTPVEQTLGPRLSSRSAGEVRIVRNTVNIGGSANILRCLELCETPWLYCLGDDDLVADDCIASIQQSIAMHPDALYFSFSRAAIRLHPAVVRTEGMAQLVERLDDWSSFLFMSSSVVNAAQLRAHARWGYLYAYSWAPLQAILFKRLESGGAVVFSDRVLCVAESRSDDTWVPFPVAAGKMVLPELVSDERLRARLARRLAAQPRLASLIYWARVKGGDSETLADHRFFVNLYLSRCGRYGQPVKFLVYRLLSFWMLCPRLSPKWLVTGIESLALKMLRRSRPHARPMSHDRT